MHQKLVTDPFLILVDNQKWLLHARNSFKNKIFLKENYEKALKKLTLFFLLIAVPFNGQDYKKQKGPGNSDQLLFMLQHLLVMNYLTKFYDVKLVLSYFWDIC